MSLAKSLTAKKLYFELLSLTQLYLLRDHQPMERCLVDLDSFKILKPFLQKTRPVLQETSLPVRESPLLNLVNPQLKEAILPTPPLVTISETKKITSEAINPIFPTSPSSIEPAQKVSNSNIKKSVNLEPLSPKHLAVDLSYKAFFNECFPHHPLSDQIPCDQLARKIKNAWMRKHQVLPVVILTFSEQSQTLVFLKNISKAISLCLAPACILSGSQLEKDQQWGQLLKTPDLRLVIACDYELYLQKNLMQHYQHSEEKNSHFLNETPLLLLSELSLYLKRPELKSFLWNAICNILKD